MPQQCHICFRHCQLDDNQIGFCRARQNRNGTIISLNYGKLTSMALDPIEKKPLAHFYPGSSILSVGTFGCNLRCPFCQNHTISMAGETDIPTTYVTPKMLVNKALELKKNGNIGIAFTYNEPLIGPEYVRDTAILAHREHLKTVAVTNGSVSKETALELLPHLDALNIDLKGFTDEYYHTLGGNLSMVKQFIQLANESSHVELTTLVVPGWNDDTKTMKNMAQWIAAVNPEIPLHVSRFFPSYHITNKNPTRVSTVYELATIARAYLKYVHIGNC